MSTLITFGSLSRLMLVASTIFSASAISLTTSAQAAPAQAKSSYGGVTFFGPAYTFQSHNGQMGNVTFFGAPPTTLPSHNGQVGNVTFLGGVQPYTYPGHSGQVGNVTFLGARPAGTVPIRTVPTPGIVPVKASRR